jgi:hypothetical protein
MVLSFSLDISSAATIVLTSAALFILLELTLLARRAKPRALPPFESRWREQRTP